ncbi:MAG: hypothetical protein JWR50_1302 [Mucilaginibacter sp.]|nr:hypothetical protein [Mucilaginibacter sp.]
MKPENAILQAKPLSIHSLYDTYAGMLLGYIFEVVKDRSVAEEYLVKTFRSIHSSFDKINWAETSNWCQLQQFAKKELTTFNETSGLRKPITGLPNKYLDRMSDEQKLVFCNIYYCKKTTIELAKEINKPEALVKKLLKEAFTIIRDRHED